MTVAENIAFGLEMLSQPRPEIDARVLDMLRLVRMEEMADRKTSQISGGQQQRVALARALAPRPKVLLLDEPLSALDYKLRKDMQIELKRLQHETGITFIFVTHDQEEALTMSDRIAVMSNGKILQVGTPHEIYEAPTSRFVANFIGETNFIKSKDGATMVVRPEHATLVKPAQGTLKGVINNIVYFGTDTHFHVRLDDGSDFMVRQQNNGGEKSTYEVGAKTGVAIAAGAAKILQD
jgi:spermidine/putrescine transport system ATP-binding protein